MLTSLLGDTNKQCTLYKGKVLSAQSMRCSLPVADGTVDMMYPFLSQRRTCDLLLPIMPIKCSIVLKCPTLMGALAAEQ